MSSLFVVAVAAAIIYRIGREVLGATRHPTDEELADFWAGRLKDRPADQRRISQHLGTCADCRDRLDEIRRTSEGPGSNAPLIERKY